MAPPYIPLVVLAAVLLFVVTVQLTRPSSQLQPSGRITTTILDYARSRARDKTPKPEDHWEHDDKNVLPYNYSDALCMRTFMDESDCLKARACPSQVSEWRYIRGGEPYPKFDADGFRSSMASTSILFLGESLSRQQVQALAWSLGHTNITWHRDSSWLPVTKRTCPKRRCLHDEASNINICWQFLGSMATKLYREGNYTLDHSLRGHGDCSHLLNGSNLTDIGSFDLVFVQTVTWWTHLGSILDSPTSPKDWVDRMILTLYYDSMKALLSGISSRGATTVLTLGQIGTPCINSAPEAFRIDDIPDKYGWQRGPALWNASQRAVRDASLDVYVVDAREPLMQAVNAFPSSQHGRLPNGKVDCVHFCMNSAALNIYLDMYWVEVFSNWGGM